MAYTYDDFVSAANSAGLLKQFTDSDLQIAQKNPEFGLSMLGVLKDGNSASTAEQKLLATEAANQLRKTYGSFGQITPYSGTYDTQIKELIDKTNNYGAFQYGGQNAYQQALDKVTGYGDFQYGNETAYQKLLESVTNPDGFQYDPEADPTWNAYKKASLREGERASANALAQASAASGGRASSYALTAAQQAANYYASQLGDLLPALQQNAYQQYLSEFEKKLSSLGVLQSDRGTAYDEWLNRYNLLQNNLNALQSDRNASYDEWRNNFDMLQTALGNLQSQDQTEYLRYLNAIDLERAAEQDLQSQEQERFNNAMALYEVLGYATPEIAEVLGISVNAQQEKPTMPEVLPTPDKPVQPEAPNTGAVTLTDAQIRELQGFLGVEADGIWGPNSTNAAGGLSAEDAWVLYQQLLANQQLKQQPTVAVTGNAGTSGLQMATGGMKDKVLASVRQEGAAGGTVGAGAGEVQNNGDTGTIGGRLPHAPVNKMNTDNRVLVEGKYLTWTEILEGVSNGTIKEEYDASTGQYRYVYDRGKGTGGNQATSSSSKKNLTTMHTR